jgi:hypothetical protein
MRLLERYPRTSRIFVSSTYIDLERYRYRIVSAIDKSGHYAVDAHHVPKSNSEVCAWLDRFIQRSGLFIGFYGFRYGSRVANDANAPSYTEFEYDRAREHLEPSLIFVLLPREGSHLETELQEERAAFYRSAYSDNDEMVRADIDRQNEFRNRMTRSASSPVLEEGRLGYPAGDTVFFHRAVETVDSADHLHDCVWRLVTSTVGVGSMMASPRPGDGVAIAETFDHPALDAAVEAIGAWQAAGFDGRPAPAMCLLFNGSDKDGQHALVRALQERNDLDAELVTEPIRVGGHANRPDYPNGDVELVFRELYTLLDASPNGDDYTDPDGFAETIYASELPIMLGVCHLSLLRGGLKLFVQKFWKPVQAALLRMHREQGRKADERSFVLIVTHERPLPADVDVVPGKPAKAADLDRPILIEGVRRGSAHVTAPVPSRAKDDRS